MLLMAEVIYTKFETILLSECAHMFLKVFNMFFFNIRLVEMIYVYKQKIASQYLQYLIKLTYINQTKVQQSNCCTDMNAFFSSNLQCKLTKVISNIMLGENIKQNELQLEGFKNCSEYILILCNILTDLNKQSNHRDKNKEQIKIFIALEVKKNYQKLLDNQQCWWLLKQVYFSDNQKVSQLIRETCIIYQNLTQAWSKDKSNLSIILSINPQNLGIVGILRYLKLVYKLIQCFKKNQFNNFMKKYSSILMRDLTKLIRLSLDSDYIYEFALTLLVEIKQCQCRINVEVQQLLQRQNYSPEELEQLQDRKISKVNVYNVQVSYTVNNHQRKNTHKTPLIRLLSNILLFMQQNHNQNAILNHYSMSNNFTAEIKQSIEFCMNQVKDIFYDHINSLHEDKLFYFNCLEIINYKFVRPIVEGKYHHQKNTAHITQIMNILHRFIQKQYQFCNQKIIDTEMDDDDDSEENMLKQRKFCMVKSLLYCNKQTLKTLISQCKDSIYEMKIVQYSLIFPSFVNDCKQHNNLNSMEEFKVLLDQLQSALRCEQDSYLLAKQKQYFIQTLLRYIVKFRKVFQKQLVLKVCFVVDLLAFKCDTISPECYSILDLLTEEVLSIQSYLILQFLQCSLQHINSNSQWLQSHECYFHIINLIANLIPCSMFNRNVSQMTQLNSLESQILTMIKNMTQTLKKKFNFQSMHKLNALLQFLIKTDGETICRHLRIDESLFIVNFNFSHQVLTQASADIYLYFCRENQKSMMDTLETYDFWEKADQEKLEFYTLIFFRIIQSPNKSFSLPEQEEKLKTLRTNLWHRFVVEKNQYEREKMAQVFKKYPQYLGSLICEYQRSTEWGRGQNCLNLQENCEFQDNSSNVIELQF